MAKTIKQAKADVYLRDTDSQSLFNNSGELSFMYFHEWNDCYDKNTGKTAQIDGETYDESTDTYKPNCPSGCIPVFNGRQSALWDNMVSCFPDRIKSMYVTMRNNGLSYKDMLMKYKEFWRYWCENLYNADAFGYANTGNFDKAFGDKLQMMDYFFQKRQRYLDSKYCCGSSVSNNLRMRLSEVGKGFAIKYYQAIYSSLQWAVGSFDTQRNIEPGTYSYMPWKMKGTPQDTTFDIDDADLITELSTYTKNGSDYTISGLEGVGNFKFDSNMGILKRLTKFVMNYTEDKPNTNELGAYFDLSGMTLLKQVIVRNVKNLTKSIVINSDVVEEIDFTNTPIVGVTTPPSDSLTKLVLPDTITTLTLNGYANLQPSGLQIAGYSNVNEFRIEDCPNLDVLDLLTKCYESNAPLTEVTITGIDWTLSSLDILIYLAQKKANLQGKITILNSVSVSLEQKMLLLSAFGDIDDSSNSLVIAYNMVNLDSVNILGKRYVDKKGSYTYSIQGFPTSGNNIKSFKWTITANNFATINQEGTLTVTKIGSKENDNKATITVSVTLVNGEVKKDTKEIYFYKKDCELGDVLFSDGSYSTYAADNPLYSPVGVVFYIEPIYKRYALAVSLKNAKANAWGLCDTTNDSAGINCLPNIQINNYTKSIYKLQDLTTITYTTSVSDATMLDESAKDNDGFKVYANNVTLGNIGFVIITEAIYIALKAYLDKLGLKKGDNIPIGQLETLYIIKHRNSILSDSAVNLDIPMATDTITEAESLSQCIDKIIANNNNLTKYRQYYYPAASYCYAYSPDISSKEELAEYLKPNHWFLPSSGELARLSFYYQHINEDASPYNIFKNVSQEGVLASFYSNTSYWSSSDRTNTKSCNLVITTGSYVSSNDRVFKFESCVIRPIVAFKL